MITNNYPVLFIFGLVVYIGIMITIAYFSSKKGSTEGEGYLMGGRNIGLLLLIATSAATAIGTGTSVGATANGFRSGWLGAVYPLANAMGLITVAFCFSHVRKFKFRTLCEELQFYYDGSHTMRKFMSVIIFVVSIIWVGSAINGGANYLSYLIGMPLLPAMNGADHVLANPDFAFSYMATTVFNPIIGLLFLIAGLSAIMSSADSDAIAGVTTFLTDIYVLIFNRHVKDEDIPKYSRILLVIILVSAFVMTIFATDVMSYISNVIGSLMPGIGVALLLGRFWKRATWQGGIATISIGIIFGICYLLITPFNTWVVNVFGGPALPVTLLTFVTGVVVSYLTPKPVHSEQERVQLVMLSREAEEQKMNLKPLKA